MSIYEVCRDCYNREKDYDGNPTGRCTVFVDGLDGIEGTSYIKDGKCQAYATEKREREISNYLYSIGSRKKGGKSCKG